MPKTGIKVSRGMTHDGIGKYLSQVVEKEPGKTDDVVGILKETGTDVVVNYLPVGSEMATKWYAEQILEAGVAMVNCMPVFIAREPYWQERFEDAGVPIIGDDIKSQVGATITHRVLTTLFGDRGVHLDKTMQLNVGGNSDFLNMLERERLESKKISKTNAVTSMLDYDIGDKNVHVGPSDYVPWLTDRKWAYIRMEGSSFGDVPLNVELKLEVWDSPNSAGIVIDAVRLAKLALNNGISGALEAPSAYLMKSPPKQIRDDEAHEQIERFIVKNAADQDEGRREGMTRFRFARIFWIGAAAILVAAALVAIAAVVRGRLLGYRRPHPRHSRRTSLHGRRGARRPRTRRARACEGSWLARGRSSSLLSGVRALGCLVVRLRRRRERDSRQVRMVGRPRAPRRADRSYRASPCAADRRPGNGRRGSRRHRLCALDHRDLDRALGRRVRQGDSSAVDPDHALLLPVAGAPALHFAGRPAECDSCARRARRSGARALLAGLSKASRVEAPLRGERLVLRRIG